MIVLDTSAVVELLLNLPLASQVRRRLSDSDVALHAPHLLTVEVPQECAGGRGNWVWRHTETLGREPLREGIVSRIAT